ncbi:MAG: hypothetical protein PF542_01210 [Nanoarchaeota archaeon]|jgi:hypothetical protein|nr:hypothetical protein [Nanoarchaeota archaeon]
MSCECEQRRILEEITEHLEKSKELINQSVIKDDPKIFEALDQNSKATNLINDLKEMHESTHMVQRI